MEKDFKMTNSETGHHGTDLLWYRPIMVQNHYGTLAIARLLRVNFVIESDYLEKKTRKNIMPLEKLHLIKPFFEKF